MNRSAYDKSLGFDRKDQFAQTPQPLYDALNKEFRFTFDPAPVKPQFDGLSIEWKSRNYVNPPYNNISAWLEKGLVELDKGRLSVFLIPLRIHTKYFKDIIMKRAREIRMLKKHVQFQGYPIPSPWMTVLVIFDPVQALPSRSKLSVLICGRTKLDTLRCMMERKLHTTFKHMYYNKALDARRWQDSFIVVQREYWLYVEKATKLAEKGYSNVLVVPARPEGVPFIPMVLHNPQVKEILSCGCLIMPGYTIASPHGSLVLLFGPRFKKGNSVGPKLTIMDNTIISSRT